MCIKINVLFSNIRVVKVLCGKLVNAAGLININSMLECLVVEILLTFT